MSLAVLHPQRPPRERMVPRYATYPASSHFGSGVGGVELDAWLARLAPGARLALRLHVPFCERLCAYCSCRTQRARSASAVDDYAAALVAEIARVARRLPGGARAVATAWLGGTPTLLPPAAIRTLGRALAAAAAPEAGAEFAVEVDPHGLPGERLEALLDQGMTTAILGLVDVSPAVQEALGRVQAPARVAAVAAGLRAAGVRSLAVELLYGLPRQTTASFRASCDLALALGAERVLLTGYAHVPWMAKRQRLVPEASLPDPAARAAQFAAGREALLAAGHVEAAVDLFVRPGDPLAAAAAAGLVRRELGFHLAGPTDATLGFGAGSISRLPQGYVQNLAETGGYVARARAGAPAAARGFVLADGDRVRGRAIEMLLVERRIDLARLAAERGPAAGALAPLCGEALRRFPDIARAEGNGIALAPAAPGVLREVAALFDDHAG